MPQAPPPGFAAPYPTPAAYGTQPAYAPAYAPPRRGSDSSTLGVVALVLALLATVGASIAVAFAGYAVGAGAMSEGIGMSPEGLENLSDDELFALLIPVREWVLAGEIAFWAGTVIGVWALVQGIVAIVRRRGRGAGIAAVAIAAVGPIVFSVTLYAAAIAGIFAGVSDLTGGTLGA
jgi:hypothetical protein